MGSSEDANEGLPGTVDQAAEPVPSIAESPPLAPTDRWWAQRWIDKATPGEIAAMRELLLGDIAIPEG